ncbi:Uma2 family endonuclease [Bacillus sp. FSL K6-3431]|uniref:Uma2 family endonuclease n=1 Tax=Bacillus sp. FSL K6-3431 TaxID=2921500 RepID=UPI004046AC11
MPHSIKRDWFKKLKIYAKYQIPEYWIIDPTNECLEQYALADNNYQGMKPSNTNKFNASLSQWHKLWMQILIYLVKQGIHHCEKQPNQPVLSLDR